MEETINNSDNNIDDSDSQNKKKVRRNKKQLFVTERKVIIDKLSHIIKLEENNNVVVYDDLVENMELKEYIISNIENIKKYYSCSSWGYFTTHLHGNIEKDNVTLLRAIYKDEGYKIASKLKTIVRNSIKKNVQNCILLNNFFNYIYRPQKAETIIYKLYNFFAF